MFGLSLGYRRQALSRLMSWQSCVRPLVNTKCGRSRYRTAASTAKTTNGRPETSAKRGRRWFLWNSAKSLTTVTKVVIPGWLKCLLGFHQWKFEQIVSIQLRETTESGKRDERVCRRCLKRQFRQVLLQVGGLSGDPGPRESWITVKRELVKKGE